MRYAVFYGQGQDADVIFDSKDEAARYITNRYKDRVRKFKKTDALAADAVYEHLQRHLEIQDPCFKDLAWQIRII